MHITFSEQIVSDNQLKTINSTKDSLPKQDITLSKPFTHKSGASVACTSQKNTEIIAWTRPTLLNAKAFVYRF